MEHKKIIRYLTEKRRIILLFLSALLAINTGFFVFSPTLWSSFFEASIDPERWHYLLLLYLVFFFLAVAVTIFLSFQKIAKEIIKNILVVFLPSQAILAFGIERIFCLKPKGMCASLSHYFPLFTVILLAASVFAIIYRQSKPAELIFSLKSIISSIKNWFKKQGMLTIFILLAVTAANLGFGLKDLANYAAVDEPLWTSDSGRIAKFWSNLKDGEWQKTNISDKPGITVALISGIGLNFVNPEEYKTIRKNGEIFGSLEDMRSFYFFMRLPILLFNALLLLVLYFFLEKLLGKFTSTASVIFIGLSPVLLGISKIVNPDSLLWIFTTLSVINFFLYLKNGKNIPVYFSGFFLGLALLTKYVANILFVFFFGLIFLEYVINYEKYKFLGLNQYLKKKLGSFAVLTLVSLLTYVIFLPAAWMELSRVWEATIFSQAFQKVWFVFSGLILAVLTDTYLLRSAAFSFLAENLIKFRKALIFIFVFFFVFSILATIANTYAGMRWFDFESILASPKTAFRTSDFFGLFWSNFFSMFFGIAPLAAISLLAFSIRAAKQKRISEENFSVFFYSLIFVFLYYLGSAANDVSGTVRYQIMIYPLIFILSSMGIQFFAKSLSWSRSRYLQPALLLVIFFSCLYSLNSIRPFYLSYANAFLPEKYTLNPKDMGDGSFEAAMYLNSLPDAQNLRVWTDKKGVCSFFKGRCFIERDPDNIEAFDYFILSSGRQSRAEKLIGSRALNGKRYVLRLDKLYLEESPAFKLEIGGRPGNFIKIIDVKKLNEH